MFLCYPDISSTYILKAETGWSWGGGGGGMLRVHANTLPIFTVEYFCAQFIVPAIAES